MSSKYGSSANRIPLDRAVGHVLTHDITEIRPGQFKGPAFKKGHIVREEDLEHLRRLGKEHLFVLDIGTGELHEDDAALRLARAFAGPGVVFDAGPSEGKISLKAACKGLLKVSGDALVQVNMVPDITCSSRHNNSLVEKDEIVAATRAIPLVIDEGSVSKAVEISQEAGGLFSVKRLSRPDTGLIITGNEVYFKRIQDKFAPLVRSKLRAFDCHLEDTIFCPDDRGEIVRAIRQVLQRGCQLVLVAGGMSVDPDDVSRAAIVKAGAQDLVYGTPILPGAMFLYGHFSG
ncbi:MAG: molybdopterin-binding protein, partial [Deltaproteobacteria bacterium]|nr:molybdopterin-binding protein [Deltaproteobacteria bacterium]